MTARSYVLSDGVLWHRTSQRTLVCPRATDVLDLEGIAALVWETLADPVDAEELANDLAAVFDQPLSAVRRDVNELLQRLVALGVVEVR